MNSSLNHVVKTIRSDNLMERTSTEPLMVRNIRMSKLDTGKMSLTELNKSIPLGHIAEPEEIANVIAFLTSDEAGYICGSLVEVNGGKAVY